MVGRNESATASATAPTASYVDISSWVIVTDVNNATEDGVPTRLPAAKFARCCVHHGRKVAVGRRQIVLLHKRVPASHVNKGIQPFLRVLLVFVEPSLGALRDGGKTPSHILSVVVISLRVMFPIWRRMCFLVHILS